MNIEKISLSKFKNIKINLNENELFQKFLPFQTDHPQIIKDLKFKIEETIITYKRLEDYHWLNTETLYELTVTKINFSETPNQLIFLIGNPQTKYDTNIIKIDLDPSSFLLNNYWLSEYTIPATKAVLYVISKFILLHPTPYNVLFCDITNPLGAIVLALHNLYPLPLLTVQHPYFSLHISDLNKNS